MQKLLLLSVSFLLVAGRIFGSEAQVEELRVLIDGHRSDMIQRAPVSEQEWLKDDAKWMVYTSLYTEALKALPEPVGDAVLKKAAADAAELMLMGRSVMRNEDRLREYVKQKVPDLRKRINATPLDDLTLKAANKRLNDSVRAIERAMISSVEKAALEVKGERLPAYVHARVDHFGRGSLLDAERAKILEWSVREYVLECINDAVNHQLAAESMHMHNFWYGNVTAEGWLKAPVKSDEAILAYVTPLMFAQDEEKGKVDNGPVQANPALVIDEAFESKIVSVYRKGAFYVAGINQ